MFDYLRYGTDLYHLGDFLDDEIVRALLLGSLVAALLVYFSFLSRRNNDRFTGFTGWIYEFLNFNRLILEGIFKILYLLVTFFYVSAYIYVILHDESDFIVNVITLIVGVVAIRIAYEFILMVIMLCRNVSDINKKMKMDQNSNQNSPYRNYSTGYQNMDTEDPSMRVGSPNMRAGSPNITQGANNMNVESPNMNRNTKFPNGNMQNVSGNQMGNPAVQPQTSFDRQSSNTSVQPQQSNGQHADVHQSSATLQQNNTSGKQPYSTYEQPEQKSNQETMSNIDNHQQEKDHDNRNGRLSMNVEESRALSHETSSKKSVDSNTEPLPVIQNVKYCNVCGNVLEADDVFCANCGNRVN